jgi:hypothetical protein
MWVKTLRSYLGLGIAFVLGGSPSWARTVPAIGQSVTVSVYDDAGVSLETMELAEETASYVFFKAGIEVAWRNCSLEGELTHAESCGRAAFPTNLSVRLLRNSRNLRTGTLGVAYLSADGTGCYTDVFVEPIEQLHIRFSVSTPNLLGQAMAHEIAHLLLGTNSHSVTGIMRASWQRKDLVSADKGLLLFDRGQADTMRKRLISTAKDAGAAPFAARSGGGGAR